MLPHLSAQSHHPNDRGGFSLSNLSKSKNQIPDSVLLSDSAKLKNRRIFAYSLKNITGDSYESPMDTFRLDFPNSTLTEGKGIAIGYLANLGSPAQTRIFSERKEARDFIFVDALDYYIPTPQKAHFYDTKIPYTRILYTSGGGSTNKEEQLKGFLTTNFGPQVNMGVQMNYIYSNGHYNSNSNKLLSYNIFGSYKSDKYQAYLYGGNFNFVNYENGGLTNDRYITNPDDFIEGQRTTDTKSFPVRYEDTWNRVRGKLLFFSHRYNLGFYRTPTGKGADSTEIFIPVSSIIHTFEYTDNRRHFISNSAYIDTCYANNYTKEESLNDRISAWTLKNTLALSLREGFQDWVKFGLTGFIRFEQRKFKMPAVRPYDEKDVLLDSPQFSTLSFDFDQTYSEVSTYVGAVLAKHKGNHITYALQGELGLVGEDIGEFRAMGQLEYTVPFLHKEAQIKAKASLKNITPAFFQRHFHSRYFWWDKELNNIQQFHAEGLVDIKRTHTQLSANVESIQNYVYFGQDALPTQKNGNIQVLGARIKQDIHFKAFGWENEAVYQMTSDKSVLPLPSLSVYTNMYIDVKLAKVLSLQLGADMHYNTAYYAPYYEPATQQFEQQQEVKVGDYPLVNAYANFHLKQTRFFIEFYNVGAQFIKPNYFSLAHYPLNPMVMKIGLSVYFNN